MLPTYTAMLEIRKTLSGMGYTHPFWEDRKSGSHRLEALRAAPLAVGGQKNDKLRAEGLKLRASEGVQNPFASCLTGAWSNDGCFSAQDVTLPALATILDSKCRVLR